MPIRFFKEIIGNMEFPENVATGREYEEWLMRERMFFKSPTMGELTLNDVFDEIIKFINERPDLEYNLVVGSDSQARSKEVCFVTALVIHRKGQGARYFYRKEYENINESLRQRIFYETSKSLEIASQLTEQLAENSKDHIHVEIHIDVGHYGETKSLIKEVTGMVTGSGYEAVIKPDSFGASKVADKYTK